MTVHLTGLAALVGTPSAGEAVVGVVMVILGGGGIAALASLITGRAIAHKTSAETKGLEAKLPAEVDSVIVQGAEAAVLTMQRALESATARITQLESEKEADRKRIESLERRVKDLNGKVEAAEREVGYAKRAGEALRGELDAFIREQGRRS